MGAPGRTSARGQEREAAGAFDTERRRLETFLAGEEGAELTQTTRTEFQKRIEKMAGGDPNLSTLENIAKLSEIQDEIAAAQKGEGKEGKRRALQEQQELLQRQPGRRQIFSF